MPTRRSPKLKIVERKLGREGAVGLCYQGLGLIEIDPRQPSKEYLDTLIHELLHAYLPDMAEEEVARIATEITRVLWKKQFRRLIP